jgi:hypothetical protein
MRKRAADSWTHWRARRILDARVIEQFTHDGRPAAVPEGDSPQVNCSGSYPDGYRVELIDGGSFPTPQDP